MSNICLPTYGKFSWDKEFSICSSVIQTSGLFVSRFSDKHTFCHSLVINQNKCDQTNLVTKYHDGDNTIRWWFNTFSKIQFLFFHCPLPVTRLFALRVKSVNRVPGTSAPSIKISINQRCTRRSQILFELSMLIILTRSCL